jgi:hypothetical protein
MLVEDVWSKPLIALYCNYAMVGFLPTFATATALTFAIISQRHDYYHDLLLPQPPPQLSLPLLTQSTSLRLFTQSTSLAHHVNNHNHQVGWLYSLLGGTVTPFCYYVWEIEDNDTCQVVPPPSSSLLSTV